MNIITTKGKTFEGLDMEELLKEAEVLIQERKFEDSLRAYGYGGWK
jgi:hypothetical protein